DHPAAKFGWLAWPAVAAVQCPSPNGLPPMLPASARGPPHRLRCRVRKAAWSRGRGAPELYGKGGAKAGRAVDERAEERADTGVGLWGGYGSLVHR
ncbi:hypothetical protein B1218_36775, partial [Pseudomonas ogarae]